jgi:Domain of unknown function (DU1801)
MSTTDIPTEVASYFAGLDSAKRDTIYPVFEALTESIPEGYQLGMHWGMPTWVVPLDTFPDTYNKQPLAFVGLAAQKNYNSLYLMFLYSDSEDEKAFRSEWATTGLALDMGKSCLRFRSPADLDVGIISRAVRAAPVARFLATYQRIQSRA